MSQKLVKSQGFPFQSDKAIDTIVSHATQTWTIWKTNFVYIGAQEIQIRRLEVLRSTFFGVISFEFGTDATRIRKPCYDLSKNFAVSPI